MPNEQLPEEARDTIVEQLMQELFPSVLPTDDSGMVYFMPTIFIGCGGTGKGIVREVRRRIKSLYPDNPLYQFVVFDTDPRYAEDFDSSEFYYLGNFDPALVVHPIAPDTVLPWWQRGYIPAGGIIDDGARTIRMLGRLAVFHNINLVCNAISTALRNALDYFQTRFSIPSGQASVYAYIISSISGGTGSGMYLDIAYLTQKLCEGSGVRSSHVVGVLGLPNIFENALNLSPGEREAIEANSYAALEELDYFMGTVRFRCNYGAIEVNSSEPPFHTIYLFGASNSVGLMLNKRETVFAMIGSALQLAAASTISQSHAASYAYVEGREAHVADRAFYSSLAAASITFPADMVVQYCGLKLADEMLGYLQSQSGAGSATQDAQAFVDTNSLNEDGPGRNQVQDYLNQDAKGQKLAIVVNADDLAQQVPADQNAGAAMRRTIQDIQNLFGDHEKVICTRAEDLFNKAKTALTQHVADVASDPSRGPGYAIRFLNDLIHLLQAYSGQMQQEAQQLEADLQQQIPPAITRYVAGGAVSRDESWARIVEQAAQSGRLFRGSRVAHALRNVASDINRYYAARLNIVLLQQSKAVFDRLVTDAQGLLSNLRGLMANLANLKGEIVRQLKAQEHRIRTLPQQESIALSIVDINAVGRLYSQTKPVNIQTPLGKFLRGLQPTGNVSAEEMAKAVLQTTIEPFLPLKQKGLVEIARLVDPDNWENMLGGIVANLFSRALYPFWSYRTEYRNVTKHQIKYYFAALPAGDQFLSELLARRPEQPQQIPTSNPHTLLVLHIEHNIPLSPLTILPQLYRSYEDMLHRWLEDKRKVETGQQSRAQYPPLHLHREWYAFPDVLPPDQLAGRLKTFALAAAYGFVRFSQEDGGVFLKLERRNIPLGTTRADAARQFVSESELIVRTEEAIRAYEDRLMTNPNRLVKQLQDALQELSRRIQQLNATRRDLTAPQQSELVQIQQEHDLLQSYLADLQKDVQKMQMAFEQSDQKSGKSRSTRKPAGRSTRRK